MASTGALDRRSPSARAVAAALLSLALVAACSSRGRDAPPAGLGRPVATGAARNLAASPDGAWLAYLDGCREVKTRFLPPRTASCDLRVVSSAGGEARRLAEAVTTLPEGLVWAPEGATLAALASYDYATGSGTLVLSRAGGEVTRLADRVTFHAFAARGAHVAYVAGGRLFGADPGGAPERLLDVDAISSFELAPPRADGGFEAVALLARRASGAGGGLVALANGFPTGGHGSAPAGGAHALAPGAGDYGFAPAGGAFAYTALDGGGYALRLAAGGRTALLGRDVRAFAFSQDGAAIAWIAGAVPGKQGDLHAGPVGKGPEVVLGREVGEYRWAARAPRLAWLERYDPRVRAGTAGAGGLDAPPRTFASNVSDVEISPDGAHVAFLQHTTRGGYSVDLGLAHVAAPQGTPFETVARGVFGFSFSPDARWLYYRTRCTRNAEACDVERVPATGLVAGGKPEVIAHAAKSFEFDPRDPERLLVTWQRTDRDALDVGVWDRGRLTTVDTYVLPGSARFLGPDSRRIGYVVLHEKRAGVYVAELPR